MLRRLCKPTVLAASFTTAAFVLSYRKNPADAAFSTSRCSPEVEEGDMGRPKKKDQLPPHHHNGRFKNPWSSFEDHSFSSFTKMAKEMKKVTPTPEFREEMKPLPIDWDTLRKKPDGVRCTWMGHASFLVQFDDITVLTDPVWSHRCSPVQFAGPQRYSDPPCSLDELKKGIDIDVVVISHNHYDHLDTTTVKALKDRVKLWCVPLGIGSWMKSAGVPAANIAELDWWESVKHQGVEFVCTPTQHFSNRGLFDRCKTLWCSWAMLGKVERMWFGGDTGYRTCRKEDEGYPYPTVEQRRKLPFCPAFQEIGEKYGPFTVAMIPIGAYSPRWFMSPIHADPGDAVDIHIDIKSEFSIGMHWGTWILTDEPLSDPPQRLKEELQARDRRVDEFTTLRIGESTTAKA